MDTKVIKMLDCFCPAIGIVVLVCLILILSGTANPAVRGFAGDDSGRVYVGVSRQIYVYENGTLVDEIFPNTSRSYAFTITADDQILLSTSTKVFLLDLAGNVLDTREDPGADTFNQIMYSKARFVAENGDIYRISSILGWTKITKNGAVTVWQNDMLSYTVKLLLAASMFSTMGFIFWIVLLKSKTGTFPYPKTGDRPPS